MGRREGTCLQQRSPGQRGGPAGGERGLNSGGDGSGPCGGLLWGWLRGLGPCEGPPW